MRCTQPAIYSQVSAFSGKYLQYIFDCEFSSDFLSSQVCPPPDVNQPATSGNSPLHVAANTGNAEIIKMLAQAKAININPKNPECGDATPLHLAAMLGEEICFCFLELIFMPLFMHSCGFHKLSLING
jgi:ankyrin repeat protein